MNVVGSDIINGARLPDHADAPADLRGYHESALCPRPTVHRASLNVRRPGRHAAAHRLRPRRQFSPPAYAMSRIASEAQKECPGKVHEKNLRTN
jgi:hypothetical protein